LQGQAVYDSIMGTSAVLFEPAVSREPADPGVRREQGRSLGSVDLGCLRTAEEVDMWAFRSLVILMAAATLLTGRVSAQQGAYTAGDVDDGGRLFLSNCASCHGPDGEAVPGVDLGHGQFRRATSDDDLVDIIRRGIQGTAMPPSTFSNVEANQIVAYLRSLAVSAENAKAPGNIERGKSVFEGKGQCLGCHRVNGNGSRLGPDLSDIGQFRRASEVQRALVEPQREVRPQNRGVRVVTRDGRTMTGRLLNHDTFTLLMIDAKEQLVSLQKSTLRDYTFVETSSMPSYRDKLSTEEITDLVRYLVSLTGVKAMTP
jgi:putative heme-binding domain-containing protein